MRLPVEPFLFSALLPTLQSHAPFETIPDVAASAGIVRSYQRARRRSYNERGITTPHTADYCGWECLHLPFDPISYHLMPYPDRFYSHCQQVRFLRPLGHLHQQVLRIQRNLQIIGEAETETILKRTSGETMREVGQIGGWLSLRNNGCQAAFLPHYCWALHRILGIEYGYAICRVDNRAAAFLMRIGGHAISEKFWSHYYQSELQIIGFVAQERAARRHESLIVEAEEHLRRNTTLILGRNWAEDNIELDQVSHVRPGGSLTMRNQSKSQLVKSA